MARLGSRASEGFYHQSPTKIAFHGTRQVTLNEFMGRLE